MNTTAAFNMPKFEPVRIPTKGASLWVRIRYAFKRRLWKLVEDYSLEITLPNGDKAFAFVPAPFIMDGASVPRIFWIILDPVGLLLLGALFHDFGYRYSCLIILKPNGPTLIHVSRTEMDEIFRQIVCEVNSMKILACIAKFAVRIGGWSTWRKARKVRLDPVTDYPHLFLTH